MPDTQKYTSWPRPLAKPYPRHPEYIVTVWGDVYSKPRPRTRGGFLKPKNNRWQALQHVLGDRSSPRVGVMVLETFVGPCPDGLECCHNNDLFCDNRLENLRWDTHRANIADRTRHGTCVRKRWGNH